MTAVLIILALLGMNALTLGACSLLLGRRIEGLGTLMGRDWRFLTSLLASAVSKEAVMAAMSVVYNAGPGEPAPYSSRGGQPGGAGAFMVAQSLSIPCTATTGMMFSETRS